MTQEELVIII